MDSDEKTWRIGELAAATGLTVRTLHYYDRIGLLRPSLRNRGGQRRYTEGDARVLYQIVALRGLGLQLNEIQECLRADVDPRPVVARQLRSQLPRLYQKALAEHDAGTDPGSEVVREIAAQLDEISAVLSGGDASITAGVRRMWTQRGDDVYPGSGIPWAGLVDYLDDRARGAAVTGS